KRRERSGSRTASAMCVKPCVLTGERARIRTPPSYSQTSSRFRRTRISSRMLSTILLSCLDGCSCARHASHGQATLHDTLLQDTEPFPNEQADQIAFGEQGEERQHQAPFRTQSTTRPRAEIQRENDQYPFTGPARHSPSNSQI